MAPKVAKQLAGKRKVDEAPTEAKKKGRVTSKITANWGKSKATEGFLGKLEASQLLPLKEEIRWRGAGDKIRPVPNGYEIVCFTEHVTRGFRPPGSRFFRRVLNHYGLRPQDIGPNSVLNISNFTVLCESYLQIPPSLPLFIELFHCKPQRECQDGPLLQCGGVSIQRRRQSLMPSLKLLSHTKDWQKIVFLLP